MRLSSFVTTGLILFMVFLIHNTRISVNTGDKKLQILEKELQVAQLKNDIRFKIVGEKIEKIESILKKMNSKIVVKESIRSRHENHKNNKKKIR